MSTPARTARRMTCTRSAPTASRAARASTPTSATGISPTSFRPTMRRECARAGADSAGFTLIEIMVVVVIIGVVAALMVLSFTLTGRDRELEKESDRLFALFTYAREQAELQTREYGVLFQDDGYEFLTYDVRRAIWRGVPDDEALVARRLPDGLGVKLTVEARPVVLTRPKDARDKTPQVMIFSNGDLTSFAATLEREGGLRSVTVTQDDQGQVIEQPMVESKP
ncbi:MAG: type II secretion system protein GspH [Gammaproteobacteria bacterium]|nr:MAG: type II secretion system protein GspH [Gammaproteobacteria bacterium]TLZ51607.1 MAG: type II secretion system protein GspH [Gammaproteobacteria bacterium]TLZ61038.1 MAG: type II secretion system protein GspH [Gammaproteobacteria bacterium]